MGKHLFIITQNHVIHPIKFSLLLTTTYISKYFSNIISGNTYRSSIYLLLLPQTIDLFDVIQFSLVSILLYIKILEKLEKSFP